VIGRQPLPDDARPLTEDSQPLPDDARPLPDDARPKTPSRRAILARVAIRSAAASAAALALLGALTPSDAVPLASGPDTGTVAAHAAPAEANVGDQPKQV
jgi:hypothetical protein